MIVHKTEKYEKSLSILENMYGNFQKHVITRRLDSTVGVATVHGLDDQGVGVRGPIRARIFISPCCPD
jgi:hypothetical protein